MKAKYIIAMLLPLALTTIVSCTRDEDDLFEKSASERAREAITNANDVLTSAEYGWEMVYFPNTENTTTSRGYIMILTFKTDGSVSVTAKNSLTTGNQMQTDTSTWELISDYGPLLSFNTYNEVFHAWADPQTDGDGYLGDYEFLILSATPEKIILKGKKHSAYSIMRPMKSADMAAHFAACEQMQTNLFGGGNLVTLQQNGNNYYLYNGSTGLFRMTAYGEELNLETAEHFPMCATTDGIIVSYGFNDETKERIFTFENEQLVGENGSIISSGNPNLLFAVYVGNEKGWTLDTQQTTGTIATNIEAFTAALRTLSGDNSAQVRNVQFGYSESANMYEGAYFVRLEFRYKNGSKTTTEKVDYEVTLDCTESNVTIAYVQPMSTNAATWINTLPEVGTLVQSLCGVFTAQSVGFNTASTFAMEGNDSHIVLKSATVR